MLHLTVVLSLLACCLRLTAGSDDSEESKGDISTAEDLISSLRTDANLDLSVDEEYEDMRAELLAYHTALAALTSIPNRRSMMSTPCWALGGICVHFSLCTGFRYLAQVPGCKNKLNVCCFSWNKFLVKDMRDKGIDTLAMPWKSLQSSFGGQGIVDVDKEPKKPKLTKKKKKKSPDVVIVTGT